MPNDLGVMDAWDTGEDTYAVSLGWTSIGDATSYQLFRSTAAGGPYTQIYNGSNNGYTDSTLEISKTYYYKVKATNLAGSSALSEPPLEVAAGQLIIIIE
jgi:fibronectin type 3 domain-containing protein